MGVFISFEGIEGCGKTTQIKLLGSYLENMKLAVLMTREPGGTPVGEEIRKVFLHSRHEEMTPLTELLLVTAARAQHAARVIKPALAEGKIVVCDRYYDATVAYQGHAGKVPLELIQKSHALFLDSFLPDLTLLLDCSVPLGLSRSRSRNRDAGIEQEEGRFEAKDLAYHEQVRQGYLESARAEPERFSIIRGEQPVEAVHQDICRAVTEKLREKGYAV